MAKSQPGDRFHVGLLFADNVLPDYSKIGDRVLNVFRDIVIAQRKHIQGKVPTWGIQALLLKFEFKSAGAKYGERVFRQAPILLDGDFQTAVISYHTLPRYSDDIKNTVYELPDILSRRRNIIR